MIFQFIDSYIYATASAAPQDNGYRLSVVIVDQFDNYSSTGYNTILYQQTNTKQTTVRLRSL